MHYDDRLATVLRLPTPGRNMARVQMTQLLDLLGAAPSDARGDLLDEAYLRLNTLCNEFPPHEIGAMVAEPGLRLRSPRLLASLGQLGPAVARASLHVAQLDEASWLDLIPALPPACWSLLWQRHDLAPTPRMLLARLGAGNRALPDATSAPDAPASSPAPEAPESPTPASGTGVERPEHMVVQIPTTVLAPLTAPVFRAAPVLAPPPQPAPPPEADAAETPAVADTPASATEAPAPVAEPPQQAADGIGAIVRRIEAFRRAREAAQREAGAGSPPPQDAPRLPLGEEPQGPTTAAFDVETDCDGCIIHADAAVAPMVVGLDLAEVGAGIADEAEAGEGPGLAELIRHQQPIRGAIARLAGAPAIAGGWLLDAVPHFDMLGGRFVGYLARFRRLPQPAGAVAIAPSAAAGGEPADSHVDRLRQSLHELRTPVNAIQGFAEIIQQQLFGATPHEYRALAAAIAADAARMLAGFEELERLARIDSGAMDMADGDSDLADSVCATLARLEHHAAAHGIGLELEGLTRPLPLRLAAIETERLCWRLIATLVSACAPGESLRLHLARDRGAACLDVSLPATLAALLESDGGERLFHAAVRPAFDGPSAGMFGTGFALRLARAEARAAGGTLIVREGRLCLRLPGLTRADAGHSHELRGKFS